MSVCRFSPPLVVVLVVLALSASAAVVGGTNTTPLAPSPGDGATLTLSAKTGRAFKREHLTLRAPRPAIRHKASYSLPANTGRWNFTTATGQITFNGGLRLALAHRALTIKSVAFNRPPKRRSTITAKIAGRMVTLLTLTGHLRVKHRGAREILTGLIAKLTNQGAKKINAVLGRQAVRRGEIIGALTITVTERTVTISPLAGASANGTGSGAASSSGVGITLVPATQALLDSLGLSAVPLPPSAGGLPAPLGTTPIPGAGGTTITLPVNGSSATLGFANGLLTGTIPLSGGLRLGNGILAITLSSPVLTLGSGTEGSFLSFQLGGGLEIRLLAIDTAKLEQAATHNGTLDVCGLLATLTSEGAESVNQLLGQNLFPAGAPFGSLCVALPPPSR